MYIGNTFPSSFGDAGDNDRGMMVYDHKSNEVEFLNWGECPTYIITTLTDILDGSVQMHEQARVKCVIDVPISFEESAYLREKFVSQYSLREFVMEEIGELHTALTEAPDTDADTLTAPNLDGTPATIDDMVIRMLAGIQNDHIDSNILIEQYRRLKND